MSNYFHKPHKLSEATRERIRQAVDVLGFVPNDAARILRTGVSPVIGYLAFELASATTPEIAAAIEQRVSAHGMFLLMARPWAIACATWSAPPAIASRPASSAPRSCARP